VAQFDKATTVARLAAARRRKSAATGMKCGGQKTYAERDLIMAVKAVLSNKTFFPGHPEIRA